MNIITKKHLLVAAASLLALQGMAFAQSSTDAPTALGWYVGASLGGSQIKPKVEAANASFTGTQDTGSTGYKLLAGYKFTSNWAVETQYQRLGTWKYAEPGLWAEGQVHGLAVSAVGLLPVGDGFSLLGKLGVVRQSFKVNARDTVTNETGQATFNKVTPLVGLGAEYALSREMAMRVEYEYFGVPTLVQAGNDRIKAHTTLLSVGVRYHF